MEDFLKAISNEKRLKVVRWLNEPEAHFPKQRDGDLVVDGVCLGAIADKLNVSQPTATAYMRTLTSVGIVVPKRIKQWTFYRLDKARLASFYSDLKPILAPDE